MAGEWIDIAIKAGIALSGAIGGLFIGIWKWGWSSGKAEAAGDAKISVLREEMRTAMASHAKTVDAKTELLVGQFRESFEGIRRQIDQNLLDAERRFLPKGEFDRFLDEYRDDQRRTDDKLDRLLGARQ